MKIRIVFLSVLIAGLFGVLLVSTSFAANKFKLAEGARGKLCLSCHESFKEKMDKPFLHSPLADGDCTGCHSPHTSDHGKLMAADPGEICYTCHDAMVSESAKSVHAVVVEGKCVLCHDPHSSDNKNNLLKAGSDLCFSCHETLGKDIAGNKVQHDPVQDDCLTCHNPHASDTQQKLLSDKAPALCVNCHDTGKATFKNIHIGYPVGESDCVSCHNPHGSNTASILYDNIHDPVSKGMCKQCHGEANSTDPLALKKEGFELCQGCHYDMMNETFNKDRVHWPLIDKTGCLNCHTPHASAQTALLKEPMIELCSNCHEDTIARQERSQTKHQPIADGECTSCHSPHGSDNLFVLNEPSIIDLCGTCHEWQNHSSHPLGADVVDPRNPNLTLNCLSCHRTHGTEYKKFLYYETTNDQCVQCHAKFRR